MLRQFKTFYPQVGQGTFVDPSAIVIGQAEIGNDCFILPNVVIRADVNWIKIGNNTNIQDGSILHVNHAGEFNPSGDSLTIGNEVTIGHKAMLHGCSLHDRCLIGMGAIVMDKVVVESNVIVAAGSVVPSNKTLVNGYLYVGAPVKQVRRLTQQEIAYLHYSAEHYVSLKKHYLTQAKHKDKHDKYNQHND